MNIRELVQDNFVKFNSYRQGIFYYTLRTLTEEFNEEVDDEFDESHFIDYQFPVPLEDIGTATLLDEDKAITFMRWIRKSIEDKTLIKI